MKQILIIISEQLQLKAVMLEAHLPAYQNPFDLMAPNSPLPVILLRIKLMQADAAVQTRAATPGEECVSGWATLVSRSAPWCLLLQIHQSSHRKV